jgi:leucyl aminopeptidase
VHAALLLRQFVKDTPWAHLDIGYQLRDTAQPLSPAGATGFGVLTVIELLRDAVTWRLSRLGRYSRAR